MTKIEWADESWNPIVGCSLVSPGCTNCYAMRQAARIERMTPGSHYAGLTQESKAGPVWTGKLALAPDRTLLAPLRRRKPTVYFVNSMGDLFHEAVPDSWIDRVFAVMALAPQHTFIVLTKRAKQMREYCSDPRTPGRIARACVDFWIARLVVPGDLTWPVQSIGHIDMPDDLKLRAWPLPNVVLGVSAERQQEADERIPDLLATPAAKRIVSAEPLLGAINLMRIDFAAYMRAYRPGSDIGLNENDPDTHWPLLAPFEHMQSGYSSPGLDGVIVGGESGPGARPMHPDWARAIRDQCAAAGVPFFFKQWGEWIGADEWLADRARDGAIAIGGFRLDAGSLSPLNFEEAARLADACGLAFKHQSDGGTMLRVGKRNAGRLLDGREHSDLPWRP